MLYRGARALRLVHGDWGSTSSTTLAVYKPLGLPIFSQAIVRNGGNTLAVTKSDVEDCFMHRLFDNCKSGQQLFLALPLIKGNVVVREANLAQGTAFMYGL